MIFTQGTPADGYQVPRNTHTLLVHGNIGVLESDARCAFPCRCVAELQDKPGFSWLLFFLFSICVLRTLPFYKTRGPFWVGNCEVMFQVSQYIPKSFWNTFFLGLWSVCFAASTSSHLRKPILGLDLIPYYSKGWSPQKNFQVPPSLSAPPFYHFSARSLCKVLSESFFFLNCNSKFKFRILSYCLMVVKGLYHVMSINGIPISSVVQQMFGLILDSSLSLITHILTLCLDLKYIKDIHRIWPLVTPSVPPPLPPWSRSLRLSRKLPRWIPCFCPWPSSASFQYSCQDNPHVL